MLENPSEPNYYFWCKMDEWNFQEAALLLTGFEPLHFKHIRFSSRKAPESTHLQEAYFVFLIMIKFKWNKYRPQTSAHPLDI